jgi:hypothetical protein
MKRKRTLTDQEEKVLIRALNRPWELWEAEFFKRRALQGGKLKRERGLRSRNEGRQQEAGRKGQHYRDIVRQLYEQDPKLRRATPHRLAQLVRAELLKRGKKAPHVRTLIRHFAPKTKV